jgi:hypothetical protein
VAFSRTYFVLLPRVLGNRIEGFSAYRHFIQMVTSSSDQEQDQEMSTSDRAPDLTGFSSYGQLKWEKDARPSAKQALRAKIAW